MFVTFYAPQTKKPLMWERLQYEERFQFVPTDLVVHVIVDHLGDDTGGKSYWWYEDSETSAGVARARAWAAVPQQEHGGRAWAARGLERRGSVCRAGKSSDHREGFREDLAADAQAPDAQRAKVEPDQGDQQEGSQVFHGLVIISLSDVNLCKSKRLWQCLNRFR